MGIFLYVCSVAPLCVGTAPTHQVPPRYSATYSADPTPPHTPLNTPLPWVVGTHALLHEPSTSHSLIYWSTPWHPSRQQPSPSSLLPLRLWTQLVSSLAQQPSRQICWT